MNSSRTSRRPPLRSGFGGDALLEDGKGLCKLIAASKTSGALNLSNRQLEEVSILVGPWMLHLGHMKAQAGAISILWDNSLLGLCAGSCRRLSTARKR